MRSQTTRRRLLAGGTAGVLASLAGCTGMTPFVGQRLTDHLSLSADDVERLAVHGRVGTIAVVGEDRADIDVDVVKKASSLGTELEALSVETAVDDGTLAITTEFDGEAGWGEEEPSVDLDIAVPVGIAIDRIETVVGAATVRNVTGDVAIESATGSIDVEDVDGSVDAESSTGRILIDGITGTATARAETGRIVVRDVGATGDLRSQTGRIQAEVPAIEGDTSIRASNGRIEAAVSPDLDAEIVAESDVGRVENDLPLADATDRTRSVRGQLGDGGPRLSVRTNTGRIELTRLD